MISRQLITAIRRAFGTGYTIIKMAYKYGIIDYAMFVYAIIVIIIIGYALWKEKWKKKQRKTKKRKKTE